MQKEKSLAILSPFSICLSFLAGCVCVFPCSLWGSAGAAEAGGWVPRQKDRARCKAVPSDGHGLGVGSVLPLQAENQEEFPFHSLTPPVPLTNFEISSRCGCCLRAVSKGSSPTQTYLVTIAVRAENENGRKEPGLKSLRWFVTHGSDRHKGVPELRDQKIKGPATWRWVLKKKPPMVPSSLLNEIPSCACLCSGR